MRLALNLVVCLLVCVELAIAQDELREWIDDTGIHKTRAALVTIHDDKVELRLENGQILTVPIVRLSTADVDYIRRQAPITNSIGMKLVLIPKGTFTMGSPTDEVGRSEDETQHEVTISQNFYLGAYEVTQTQYQEVMGENPSLFKQPRNPVEQVSWEDAVEFCKRMSELPAEKAAGRVYRLPSEAEWEYACRAGSTTKYNFGDDNRHLGSFAWQRDNSKFKPHSVGQKQPNAWGLYDMHGNVWEWCADWYREYPSGAVSDPLGPLDGSGRVYRGGGWGNDANYCRTAGRSRGAPSFRFNAGGFRVALNPTSQVPLEPGKADGAEGSGASTQGRSAEQQPKIPPP